MKKVAKMLAAIGLTGVALCNMTGCASLWDIIGNSIDDYFKDRPPLIEPFEDRCVTTEDGFTYYVDSNDGLCIIDLPDMEEVTIPEYIDGQRVMQLGYEEKGLFYGNTYWLDGRHVKILSVQHKMSYYLVNFMNVETFKCINPLDSIVCNDRVLVIDRLLRTKEDRSKNGYDYYSIGLDNVKEIWLSIDNKQRQFQSYDIDKIFISEYVKIIEAGVFDGLDGVTIKTSYESKPDGWEEGWNGNCPVEWGAEIQSGYEIQ